MSEQKENKRVESSKADMEQAGEKLVLTSPEEARTAKDFLLWAGVIVLAVLTVYSPAIRGQFIWDDDRHVEHSPSLRMGAEGLQRIWFAPASVRIPQYYPLTYTTYWIEYQFAGDERTGEINPLIFHLTNVILHAAGAILLWFILRRLNLPGAWVIAAIFALHPIEVESVAWISERKNVLCGAFYFGAVLSYLKALGIGATGSGTPFPSPLPEYGEREQAGEFPWNMYLASLGLFVAAMLSKTVACSMPAVVLLLIWWRGARLGARRAMLGLVPFFVIGVALAVVTVSMEKHNVGATGPEWNLSIAQRILIAGRAIWFYIAKTLVPVNLTFIYPRWDVEPGQIGQWIYPIGVVAVLAILAALRRRIGRGPLIAALIYCGVLVPALGFFDVYPMRYSFVADHFQYLAGPVLIAMVVVGIAKILGRARKGAGDANQPQPLPYVLAACVLLLLAFLSFQRAQVFTGMTPLWRDVIAKNPSSWMAQYNLGTALMEDAIKPGEHDPTEADQMLDEAAEHFASAVQLKPDHDNALNNWGNVLLRRGQIQEAIAKFRQALAVDPKNVQAMINLGRALLAQKKYDEAAATLWQARELAQKDPSISKAQRSLIEQLLGETLAKTGQTQLASGPYAEAIELNPGNLSARYQYGELLARQGKLAEAAAQFDSALRINSSYVPARIRVAQLQMKVGNLRAAQRNLYDAARIDPNAPLLAETVQLWSKADQASTQPSATQPGATRAGATRAATTRAATRPSPEIIREIDALLQRDATTRPSTQPATLPVMQPATQTALK